MSMFEYDDNELEAEPWEELFPELAKSIFKGDRYSE